MNRFTLSALGPLPPLEIPPKAQAIAAMKRHWTTQLDYVLPQRPRLILLHECCDRFPAMSMEDRLEYYGERGQVFRDFFGGIARDNDCYIAYSAIRQLPDGTRRNSTQLLSPDGTVAAIYDKFYPVIEEKTLQDVQAGESEVIAHTPMGDLGFAICFDLNFQDLLQRYAARHPHLILFSSMYHGGLMQSAWAYQCRSWFAGAIANNECAILNPLGHKVACSTNYFHFVTASINTDYEVVHLDYNRGKLLQAQRKYGRGITVFDPGNLGSVLLSSELPDVTASQIVDEFGIERLDHYFRRVHEFWGRP